MSDAGDAIPSVPDSQQLDGGVQAESNSVLDDSPYETGLGLEMAEDARRVSTGELSSEEFWQRYDGAAADVFGDAYRETPNPAVDRIEQTIDDRTAESLDCEAGSMEEVAGCEVASVPDGSETGAEEVTWGMVIDLQKCVGCESCTVACKAENRTPPGVSYNVVLERERGEYPNVSRTNLPRPCMQCERPPCVQVCPVSATYRMDNGIVNLDYERCIGCRYCMIACPYEARYFDFGENYEDEFLENGEITSPEYGVDRGPRDDSSPVGNVRKCNFCHHRLQRGEEPACVETCVGDARYMGNLDNTDSEVNRMAASPRAFQLKEKEGTDPNVYYLK
ncbi:Fe-S-cluster-containing dehydrogenase component [Halalkaliarchaeum sp. AArc-CO]|uniref:4Fe-4S dicluster domain-containing protein n=1 Tax=unclassified Halalkaliarchaeum TaxID=2678344 RepID=UPI00217E111D|nr:MULTISPECIES: 4Fe-4S dicluster domain-containing protein [unclassified Halalkaliarchaeum]MDR5672623.1 4Fe-4S ferredoxin N-terminal domain-containing protein [Halalkaliarchaeum sp. AArc-GB]UWG50422.1 Fe-S-cluster-containing dehydrogenase component [Halalkaliarchaeum sp. AArc-CO]